MSRQSNVMNEFLTDLSKNGFEAEVVEIGKLKENLDIEASKLQVKCREVHEKSNYKPLDKEGKKIEHSVFNSHINNHFRPQSPEAVKKAELEKTATRLKVLTSLVFLTKDKSKINEALANDDYDVLTEKEIKKLTLV